jgi:hypothetical protein
VLEREVYYFLNCGAGEVILANVSGDVAPCAPDFHGDAKDVVSGGIYTLNIELYQEKTGALLAAAKVTKLLAIPATRRALLREAERLILKHHKPAPRTEERPAPVVEKAKSPDLPAPVQVAAAPAPASTKLASTAEAALDAPALRQKLRHRLRQLLSEVSQHPLHEIDAKEPLEAYGIDSMMIARLNHELEHVFPGLSKTLFFEHQTLDGVAGHLMAADARSAATWAGGGRADCHHRRQRSLPQGGHAGRAMGKPALG